MKINTYGVLDLCDLVMNCSKGFEYSETDSVCQNCARRHMSLVVDVEKNKKAYYVCPLNIRKQDAEDLIRILEKYTDTLYDAGLKVPNEIDESEFIQLLRKENGL